MQVAWCYCSVSSRVSLDSTAIVGACLVAFAMRVQSTQMNHFIVSDGLHCPCDSMYIVLCLAQQGHCFLQCPGVEL